MPTSPGQPKTGLAIPMSPAQTADTELGKALSETSTQVAKHPRGPTQAGALECSYRVQSEEACREDAAGAVSSLRDEATPADRQNLGSRWPRQDTDLTHPVLPRPCQPLSFLFCCCSLYQAFSSGPPTSSEITTWRLFITQECLL